MTDWNRTAIEHWVNVAYPEQDKDTDLLLGLFGCEWMIPLPRLIASGLRIRITQSMHSGFYQLFRDMEYEMANGKNPFNPYQVSIEDQCFSIAIQRLDAEDVVFPATGVYVYHHPYEGYKIGQAENVPRRMTKHWCSAPAAKLLHVIETNNLDWCETFIHNKLRRWRRHANHEYFDLTYGHLGWLFSIGVLNKPDRISDQLSLLDLL